jgi:hypothetical protein
MIGVNTSPLLKINRVVVTGDLGCDVRLSPGINIIKGEAYQGDSSTSNNCGKTLFTDLIKYGLGDRDRFSPGDISEKIDTLLLEIELNGKLMTISRGLNTPATRVAIYFNQYQNNLELQEPNFLVTPTTDFSNFLLEHLNIPNVRIPQSNKPGATIKPITFQDFMRVFYMDQKNSFQEILYKVQPDSFKTKTLKILLGLSKEQEEELSLRIKELIDKIADLEREIRNISAFLTKSGGKNRIDLLEQKKELLAKIQNISNDVNLTKQKMRGDRGITDEIRERLEKVNSEIANLMENRTKILLKVEDFRSLRNSLLIDKEKVEKTREASFILSSISFDTCPRCLQDITASMKRREDEANCMLCGRPLIAHATETRVLDKHKIVEEEIQEVETLLEKYAREQTEIDIKLQTLVTQKNLLHEELDKKNQYYVSPFIDELERLLHLQNQVNAEIEIIDQQLNQWYLLEEKEKDLTELSAERANLQSALADIDTRDDTKLRKLSDYYESFLRGSKFPNLVNSRIQALDLMPLVNSRIYTENTGSGLLSIKVIGYHFSLLRFSIDNPCYYPRFLMLDSPRAFDVNRETYSSVLKEFLNLEKKSSRSDFQVIITTRDLPEELEPMVIERLNSKNRMLLRKDGEREQSSIRD